MILELGIMKSELGIPIRPLVGLDESGGWVEFLIPHSSFLLPNFVGGWGEGWHSVS